MNSIAFESTSGTTDTIAFIVAAVVLGCLQGYSQWRQSRLLKASKQQIDTVTVQQTSIMNKQEEMKVLLDGPLGKALKQLAEMRENIARISLDPTDILAAEAARTRSDDHEATILSQGKIIEAQKVIAEAKIIEGRNRICPYDKCPNDQNQKTETKET